MIPKELRPIVNTGISIAENLAAIKGEAYTKLVLSSVKAKALVDIMVHEHVRDETLAKFVQLTAFYAMDTLLLINRSEGTHYTIKDVVKDGQMLESCMTPMLNKLHSGNRPSAS